MDGWCTGTGASNSKFSLKETQESNASMHHQQEGKTKGKEQGDLPQLQ
jgi:hypothetical protein